MTRLKQFYYLTKPGIIVGNLITTLAGFALASRGAIALGLLLATLAGLALVIASACVFNNYSDREIDQKMARTKQRGLASGAVSAGPALVYASGLGLIGLALLILHTNYLATAVAVAGFFIYVVLYRYWKRRSVYGTVVGSLSGAVPPVVGYTAVSQRLDAGAVILFMTMVLWQMPHFFAIAIYRLRDYAAAGLPVLPVKKGIARTKANMTVYVIGFLIVGALLFVHGYAGRAYLVVLALCGAGWLWLSLRGFAASDEIAWARRMFVWSLVVITLLCAVISLEAVARL